MFDYLADFNRILVTGPQRSGTTIVARAIAHDTGKEYLDEGEFQATNEAHWNLLVKYQQNYVMQCPGMCRYVHRYGDQDDLAVVMVKRPVDEIIASQERIDWKWEKFELIRYGKNDGVIAEVKYDFWDMTQRDKIKHAFEVDYHSLADHPLWVPAEQRADFTKRQWQL